MLVFLYRVIMCCMLIVFSEGMVIISSLVVVLWIMVGVLFNVLRIGRFCSLVFCRWGVLLSSLIGWKLLDWCRLWIRVLVVCFVFRISIWCVLVFDCSVWQFFYVWYSRCGVLSSVDRVNGQIISIDIGMLLKCLQVSVIMMVSRLMKLVLKMLSRLVMLVKCQRL